MRIIVGLVLIILFQSCKETLGVTQRTPSGYDYKKLEEGSGGVPSLGDYVKFSFSVVADDGTSIQAVGSPESFPIVEIPVDASKSQPNPITEILTEAMVGDSFEVIMPVDSFKAQSAAYQQYKHLKYLFAVKEILDKKAYEAERQAKIDVEEKAKQAIRDKEPEVAALVSETLKKYKEGALEVVTTESGLKYFIHEAGDGKICEQGDVAVVNYYGVLTSDGSMFDNSFSKGKPFKFAVGTNSVIKGWDEALSTIPQESKASLFIPAELAYGATPRRGIPANSELMFYIDVE
jgi:FKBP-type peptidyl-prolyl cis-trans isomerase